MRSFIILKNKVLWFCLAFSTIAHGQQTDIIVSGTQTSEYSIAPVKLDGHLLFNVRGVSSLPAEERASNISNRIRQAAANDSISAEAVRMMVAQDHIKIYAGSIIIMQIYDADAAMEGITKTLLAQTVEQKVRASINLYRQERSPPVLMKKMVRALIATVILGLLLLLLLWLIRRIKKGLQKKIQRKIESVEDISYKLIKSNQIWKVFHVLIDTIRVMIIAVIFVFFVDYVLGLFPWTNEFANYTLYVILDPIISLGNAFIGYIPKFVFLVVIYFITKYVLQLIRLFFAGIDEGGIAIKDFKPEWAIATFRIIKVIIIAFSVVIAYPYIPGSDSIAFKGVSVFVGVLFSLGSSSFIGNIIAGYSMIYRGAFKKGDRIEVDNLIGYVEEQRLMITRLRSLKNEEIVIPNTVLLNSKIVNYSTTEQELGTILHTTVGIGYETPWRQVDAMLKLAADRTEGLSKEPKPFVLKKSLGDFAVNYEINAYCKEVSKMNRIYTLLHQNILDVFNENNVQIMTPFYIRDPEIPKIVPKDQWNTPLTDENL
ncbi:MAG: mechanosensitive ion channel family protein [Maribacter sp.]|nr:mechanosensitive ion channel family protein [Maribacter sp.]